MFTVKLLHSNLYARVFKLRTDYKPLLRIFGENCGLPATAVSCLQRWPIILSGYDYIIEHLLGHEQEIAVINAVEHNAHDPVEDLPVSAADVAMVSKQGPDENRVIDYIAHGGQVCLMCCYNYAIVVVVNSSLKPTVCLSSPNHNTQYSVMLVVRRVTLCTYWYVENEVCST